MLNNSHKYLALLNVPYFSKFKVYKSLLPCWYVFLQYVYSKKFEIMSFNVKDNNICPC